MMCPRDRAVLPASRLASLVAAALVIAPAAASACSLVPYPTVRGPGMVAFVGTALSDTLQAGPGPIRFRLDDGHFGRGVDRAIHGQIVRLDRLARASQDEVGAAVANARGEVVLVPWDYAADCTPVPWGRSARWLVPGTSGFFTATLRDSVGWVGGRPTFDVIGTQYRPFPSAPGYRYVFRNRDGPLPADSILTADGMLDLYDALPRSDQTHEPAPVRYASLWTWAEAQPDLARRRPASQLVVSSRREARREPEERRILAMRSPLAGTYRFVFTLGSGDTLVVFARSEPTPTSVLWSEIPLRPGDPRRDSVPTPAAGYYLLVEAAPDERELPLRRNSGLGPSRQGYLNVVEQPALATADSTVWRVGLDLGRVAGSVVGNERVTAELRDIERVRYELFRTQEMTFTPGRLVRYADGRLRVHEAIRRGGTSLLVIRGERISEQTLDNPRRP